MAACGKTEDKAEKTDIAEYEDEAGDIEGNIISSMDGITTDNPSNEPVSAASEWESMPYFHKEDYSGGFGDETIATNGNLVTVFAMLENYYVDNTIIPDTFAEKYAKWCSDGSNSLNHDVIPQYAKEIGMECEVYDYDFQTLSDALKILHGCVIVYIPHNSVYGQGGAYLLVTEAREDGLVIHDPCNATKEVGLSYEDEYGDLVYNPRSLAGSAGDGGIMYVIY